MTGHLTKIQSSINRSYCDKIDYVKTPAFWYSLTNVHQLQHAQSATNAWPGWMDTDWSARLFPQGSTRISISDPGLGGSGGTSGSSGWWSSIVGWVAISVSKSKCCRTGSGARCELLDVVPSVSVWLALLIEFWKKIRMHVGTHIIFHEFVPHCCKGLFQLSRGSRRLLERFGVEVIGGWVGARVGFGSSGARVGRGLASSDHDLYSESHGHGVRPLDTSTDLLEGGNPINSLGT